MRNHVHYYWVLLKVVEKTKVQQSALSISASAVLQVADRTVGENTLAWRGA